jgi:hypothetical protein
MPSAAPRLLFGPIWFAIRALLRSDGKTIMRRLPIRFLALVGASLLAATVSHARALLPQITFDNKSGQPALVKLVGPTHRAVQVPDRQERMVTATGGQYYILTRYGDDPEHYTYSRGDAFTVLQTSRGYSVIRITLHTVVNGNYYTNPISASEFDKENQ